MGCFPSKIQTATRVPQARTSADAASTAAAGAQPRPAAAPFQREPTGLGLPPSRSAHSGSTATDTASCMARRRASADLLQTRAPAHTAAAHGRASHGSEGADAAACTRRASTGSVSSLGDEDDCAWLRRSGLAENDKSTLTLAQQTLIGVARWPEPHNKEDNLDQRKYGLRFSNESIERGNQLKQGKVENFDGLWNSCRDARVRTLPDGNQDAPAFKKSRIGGEGGDVTPINNGSRYTYVVDRALEKAKGSEQDGMVLTTNLEPAEGAHQKTSYTLTATLQLENELMNLTELQFTDDRSVNIHRTWIQFNAGESNSDTKRDLNAVNKIKHTPPEHLPKLMERADQLFREIRSPNTSSGDRMKGLAELHWLLAHAMPDCRGSAAKSELAVRSIAHSVDQELPPFKKGVVPDLEAFLVPKDQFVAKYADMLEEKKSTAAGSEPAPQNSAR